MNKVKDGTPNFGATSMCATCRNCHRMQTPTDHYWMCDALVGNTRVPQPVIKCNKYDDATQPSMHQMQAIAWRLNVDKKGNFIGFMSPKEWNKRAFKPYVEDETK